MDWSGQRRSGSYSDSKLFVTALAVAVARIWPDVYSNAVDPGWVPTRMGGAGAPYDLRLGHLIQDWLTTSDEPAVAYAAHGRPGHSFHKSLLDALASCTGVPPELRTCKLCAKGAASSQLSNQSSNDVYLVQQSGMDGHGQFRRSVARLYAYENSFGTKRSQAQILSPRPIPQGIAHFGPSPSPGLPV